MRVVYGNIAHESRETPFVGGHRTIPQIFIEQLFQAALENKITLFDLKTWCCLAEIKIRGAYSSGVFDSVPIRVSLLIAPDDTYSIGTSFCRRRRKIFKSWDRLLFVGGGQLGYDVPEAAGSLWVKVPRLLLRYLAQSKSRAEILIALLACCRSLRNRRYQFRFHQERFAKELGFSRETVSNELKRLRKNGLIRRLSSWPGAIKKYGHLYQWTMVRTNHSRGLKTPYCSHLNHVRIEEKSAFVGF